METPASVHRHPIQTILVGIPIGLWLFSFACDVAVLVTDVEAVANLWYTIAYYTMLGGFAAALLAIVPGLIDYRSLTDGELRKLATTHMAINLTVVALYGVNLWVRAGDWPSFDVGMGLSVLALALLAISGGIGAEMVHVHRVGIVEADAAPRASAAADARSAPGVTRMGHALDYEPR
jgi:uncharacterized membrane protein